MSEATTTHVSQELRDDLDRAKRETAELAGAARERGREHLEDAKRRAADETDRVAGAVETTADRLEADGDASIGGYGRSIATMMRRLAGGLRDRDIDEFASELATFARRQPGAFIAGSVALGFGMSRFLKANPHREHEAYSAPQQQPIEPGAPTSDALVTGPLPGGPPGNPPHNGGAS